MQRHFLGWSKPFLASLAEFLSQEFSELKLNESKIVLPSANAGRGLEKLLKEKSITIESKNIYSLGELPDLFFNKKNNAANKHEKLNSLIKILEKEDLSSLFPNRDLTKKSNSFLHTLSLTILQLHAELSSAGLSFIDVKEKKDEQNSSKWDFLENIKKQYILSLKEKNLTDNYQNRIEELKKGNVNALDNLIICSCYDLSPLSSELISGNKKTNTNLSMIFAPKEHENGFNEIGSIIPEYWISKNHIIPDSFISIADSASEQSENVFLSSKEIIKHCKITENLRIGIPGIDIVPSLKAAFSKSDFELRDVSGYPIRKTNVFSLIEKLYKFINSNSYKSFTSLLRHNAVAKKFESNTYAELLKKSDTFYVQNLPKHWLPEYSKKINIFKECESLFQTCIRYKNSKTPFSTFIEILENFFPADTNSPKETSAIKLLIEIAQTTEIDFLSTEQFFKDFLSRVLLLSKNEKITEIKNKSSIDMMGWLELALDPSPYLLLTGMNDSNIPGLNMDNPFLNDSLRKDLGLPREKHKIARDCFIFETILNSKKLVHLFSSKKSSRDESLMLCRLLLKDSNEIVAKRTLSFYSESSLKQKSKIKESTNLFSLPSPKKGKPLNNIRVSAFKDYLYCPYIFYLKHVLGLKNIDDQVSELNPPVYGTLTHSILEQLPTNTTLNLDETKKHMEESFDKIVNKKFNKNTLPTALTQLELLKQRLEFFTEWQSEQFSKGWIIWQKELLFKENPLNLEVNKKAKINVTGSIDRIDFNKKNNTWRIIDYKTSESQVKISDAYKKSGDWEDLQLPLYAEFAIQNIPEIKKAFDSSSLEIAYVNISKDFKNKPLSSIIYTQEMRKGALNLAKEIAEFILKEDYLPPNQENWSGPFKNLLPELEYVE